MASPSTVAPSPSSALTRWLPTVLGASAAAAVLGAGLLGGIFAPDPLGFSDGGSLTRWGLPLARTGHHVAAALTIGLLLLAGTVIPEGQRTQRRATATHLAWSTGVVWIVCGLLTTLFSISSISFTPLTDPTFLPQVMSVIWSVEYFRVQFISLLVACVAVFGAALVRTRAGITWMAALSIGALLPLALIGHAGGAEDHDTAVNALAVHLVGVSVWAGGLGAILLLWRVITPVVHVVVRRYSTLAAWSFAAVAISGVLSGALRLGGWHGLTSMYGALFLVKVALLALLGVAGWRMRTRYIATLEQRGAQAKRPFVRWAVGEIVILGLAIGTGAALARTAPPVSRNPAPAADPAITLTGYAMPDGPLTGWGWLTTWRIDWFWTAVALVAMTLYGLAVYRLHRRGDAWAWTRTVPWMIGWVILIWTTSGAPGVYGRIMFSVHMVMHMTLAMIIPILLCLGAPLTLASRTLTARHDKTLGPRELLLETAHSRYLTFWANPLVASVNFFGSLILFYFTDLFDAGLRTHTGHMLMIGHFLAAGYMFAWVLIGVDPGPKRWPPSLRLLLLFATMSSHAFFGVALVSFTTVLAPDFFSQLKVPWVWGKGGDPWANLLGDQIVGGGITWGFGEIPMLFLAIMVGYVWMTSEEREAKRLDRQADRDHDAALEAYNAMLERQYQRDTAGQDSTASPSEPTPTPPDRT